MSEVDDFLAHYGVSGMKWGKKQSGTTSLSTSGGYSRKSKIADNLILGHRISKKIENKVVNEGLDTKTARKKVVIKEAKSAAKGAGIALGILALPVIASMSTQALYTATAKKKMANGRAASNNMFADSRGIANYPTIRLQQNPTTGNWV